MVKTLNINYQEWLSYATSPLPETLRITTGRNDIEWTKSELVKLGGKPISWMAGETAWQLPFERGKAPTEYAKRMLTILHDTGRITRQEAASMLPVELLDLDEEVIVLDMCAAPGSKTTQVAEKLADRGFVIANEPVSSRANMLISNRARVALTNVLINQQDGRHIGRIPPPGYDAIIADVPCTGTATTRKNMKVWTKWKPIDSRSLFNLQLTIAQRGARSLKPGGKMVYSTCSIDPIENEAVVAELLRTCPWMELIEINDALLDGLKMHSGLSEWAILDDNCNEQTINDELPKIRGLKLSQLCPNDRKRIDGDSSQEDELAKQLLFCRRLYHMDNDTGGFFVAMLKHREDATPEGKAIVYLPKRAMVKDSGWEPRVLSIKNTSRHAVIPADLEKIEAVSNQYQLSGNDWSWWQRGKRLNIAPKAVYDRLYHPMCPNKEGNLWQNDTFHPLKIIHAGMPCFVENKGAWRTRQEAIPAIENNIGDVVVDIDRDMVGKLLNNEPILKEQILSPDQVNYNGPIILGHIMIDSKALISAWCGTWISLMINDLEKDILRAKLSLPFADKCEV